ncbi:MAG TPA: hypothetical protein VM389_11710, partial [Phycisphaerae bacterium]|nr:hypothetical protein [Phycisphaerae bacterium]
MTMPSVHEAHPIEAAPPRTSVWPVVLGVLSIVAGFDATRAFAFASPADIEKTAWRLLRSGFGSTMAALDPWITVCLASFVFAGVLGVLAGAMLLLRRRAALVVHWLCAAAFLGALGVFSIFLFLSQPYMEYGEGKDLRE